MLILSMAGILRVMFVDVNLVNHPVACLCGTSKKAILTFNYSLPAVLVAL